MSGPIHVRYAASVLRCCPVGVLPGSAARVDFAVRGYQPPNLQQRQDGRIHRLGGQTMGTTWSLQLANPEFRELDAVHALLESMLQDVIAQMSNWQGDSVISRFNAAPADSWHALPPAFARVLAAAMQWAERSAGALDPTMGALVSLWGFGPRAEPLAPHSGQRPSEAQIDAARAQCGFQRLDWVPGQARIRQPGGLQLDLCGIAKGFAVDAVVQRLRHDGWEAGLFEIGGELRGFGARPDGRPWQIQLAATDTELGAPWVVPVTNGAFATSGDCWHHFLSEGQRYSHTLDPRTGWPTRHALASVTVHHDECMHADALATVLTVMGVHEGMAFAQAHDVAAVFQEHADGDGDRPQPLVSPAWKARFEQ